MNAIGCEINITCAATGLVFEEEVSRTKCTAVAGLRISVTNYKYKRNGTEE